MSAIVEILLSLVAMFFIGFALTGGMTVAEILFKKFRKASEAEKNV